MPGPCTVSVMLSAIPANLHDRFHEAAATVGNQFFRACWADTMQGQYFVLFDDGDSAVLPVTAFTEPPSV